MATFKPLRLKRLLDRIVGPGTQVFAFRTDEGIFYEDSIQEVVIRRGKSDRGGGMHPTTMEVKVVGMIPATMTGTDARFSIRDVPADRIAAHLDGSSSGADMAMRGVGRVGALDVEDTGKKFFTSVTTASWTARMLRRVSLLTAPQPGQTPADVLMNASGFTATPPPGGLFMTAHGPFDTVATAQDSINFRDAVAKFGENIGVCLLDTRAGVTRIMSLPARTAAATAAADTWLPLIRSQGIAPAQWQQVNDAPAIKLNYTITNPDGNVVMRTIDTETWDPTFETVDVDWSYMKSASSGTSGHSYQEAYGLVYQSSSRIYRLPTVTVDLIHLIGSDKQYHREVAAQLLRMETGDPVFLSGDWPAVLRGVHFAEGITEKITPNSWTLEFSLSRWAYVLGAAPQPDFRPRVWESASNKWDDDPRQWQQF